MVVFVGFALSETPTNAGMIFPAESDYANEFAASIDTSLILAASASLIDPVFGWQMPDLSGSVASSTTFAVPQSDGLSSTPQPLEVSEPTELPMVGLGAIAGAGDSASSSGDSSSHVSSNEIAMIDPNLPLRLRDLSVCFYFDEALEVPPTRPFELLRPPRVLTTLA